MSKTIKFNNKVKDKVPCDPAEELKAWDVINTQTTFVKGKPSQVTSIDGWKEVRLFVSSTFSDFHCEREVLVKRVFPELREWCSAMKLRFVECDLRWGIPKDSNTGETIRNCLSEIDNCSQKNGDPFFLGLVSERFGWIPSQVDIPTDVKYKYGWIDGLSMTAMEIVHSSFHGYKSNDGNNSNSFSSGSPEKECNPNAAFFFRNPDFLNSIPQSEILSHGFVDSVDHLRHITNSKDIMNSSSDPVKHNDKKVDYTTKLSVLKSKIIQKYKNSTFNYDCTYDGIDPSTSKIQLSNMDYFADTVLEFFKKAISKQYQTEKPATNSTLDSHSIWLENHVMNNYMQNSAPSVTARQQKLLDSQEFEPVLNKISSFQDLNKKKGTKTAITGPPGSGKTTYLSRLATYCKNNLKKTSTHVFIHYCNVDQQVSTLLKRLKESLKKSYGLSNHKEEPEETPESLCASFWNELDKKSGQTNGTNKSYYFFIDQVDKLKTEVDNKLWWIRGFVPYNCHFIIGIGTSMYEPKSWENSIRLNGIQVENTEQKTNVGGSKDVDNNVAHRFVTNYLKRYNKKLTKNQLNDLLDNTIQLSELDCKYWNPLWLNIVSEELRIFGVFEKVDDLIGTLSATKVEISNPNFENLFLYIIKRMQDDYGKRVVGLLLSSLALSREGLYEHELRRILGWDEDRLLPLSTWLPLMRSLTLYISRSDVKGSNTDSKYHFNHDLFLNTVRKYYNIPHLNKDLESVSLIRSADGLVYLSIVTEYFELHGSTERKAEELPYLYIMADNPTKLKSILLWWDSFRFWYTDINKYEFYRLWRKTHTIPNYKDVLIEITPSKNQEEEGMRYYEVGDLLYNLAHYSEGLFYAEKAVSTLSSISFSKPSSLAYAKNLLAKIKEAIFSRKDKEYRDENESEKESILNLYKEALTIRKRTLGTYSILVSNSINNLAVFNLMSCNRPWDALPLFQEALTIAKYNFGNEHPEVADIYNNMALCYEKDEKFPEAYECHQNSIIIRERLQGNKHPKIAASFTNLGNLKRKEGKLREAHEYFIKSYRINENVYGQFNHPLLVTDYENMADVHYQLGDYQEAKKFFQFAQETLTRLKYSYNSEQVRKIDQAIKDVDAYIKASEPPPKEHSMYC
eukprot:TRINITY_DN3679_c0_g1_i1.p1 TRINITY_DN3679_c0_g1~~TRINITY_DN3679_c0_g1_i1.p1  ORF type:complete len:1132 (-),score=166.27 TRINITY_DN3679_c0_g1_i1:262-3657(-)